MSFQSSADVERAGNCPTLNQLAAFFGRVERHVVTGCWLWRGSYSTSGYGVISGSEVSAHRQAYRWFIGPIPEGTELDHLCRIRACVNPAHLEAVAKSENQQRAVRARVVCKNGHPWVADNLTIVSSGRGRKSRTCSICHDRRNAESRARVRQRNAR